MTDLSSRPIFHVCVFSHALLPIADDTATNNGSSASNANNNSTSTGTTSYVAGGGSDTIAEELATKGFHICIRFERQAAATAG